MILVTFMVLTFPVDVRCCECLGTLFFFCYAKLMLVWTECYLLILNAGDIGAYERRYGIVNIELNSKVQLYINVMCLDMERIK